MYLMEFLYPFSDLCKTLVPTPGFEKKLHAPPVKMLFLFHSPPSDCAELWSPPP